MDFGAEITYVAEYALTHTQSHDENSIGKVCYGRILASLWFKWIKSGLKKKKLEWRMRGQTTILNARRDIKKLNKTRRHAENCEQQ